MLDLFVYVSPRQVNVQLQTPENNTGPWRYDSDVPPGVMQSCLGDNSTIDLDASTVRFNQTEQCQSRRWLYSTCPTNYPNL